MLNILDDESESETALLSEAAPAKPRQAAH
jgi:hypothetical protein